MRRQIELSSYLGDKMLACNVDKGEGAEDMNKRLDLQPGWDLGMMNGGR